MNWYYPLKESVPFLCDMALREERAFDNMCSAIDMQEIFERPKKRIKFRTMAGTGRSPVASKITHARDP